MTHSTHTIFTFHENYKSQNQLHPHLRLFEVSSVAWFKPPTKPWTKIKCRFRLEVDPFIWNTSSQILHVASIPFSDRSQCAQTQLTRRRLCIIAYEATEKMYDFGRFFVTYCGFEIPKLQIATITHYSANYRVPSVC